MSTLSLRRCLVGRCVETRCASCFSVLLPTNLSNHRLLWPDAVIGEVAARLRFCSCPCFCHYRLRSSWGERLLSLSPLAQSLVRLLICPHSCPLPGFVAHSVPSSGPVLFMCGRCFWAWLCVPAPRDVWVLLQAGGQTGPLPREVGSGAGLQAYFMPDSWSVFRHPLKPSCLAFYFLTAAFFPLL